MPPPNACSIFSLEWASPLPALQTFYLSFILQSMSKCLFPNPHLPLALAEISCSYWPLFALPLQHWSLWITNHCVCCLSHKMTSSLRTGSLLLIWGFPKPSDNSLLQSRHFSVCCWILLKGFTETQGSDFQQLFTLVCTTDEENEGNRIRIRKSPIPLFYKECWWLHWNAIFKERRASGLKTGAM